MDRFLSAIIAILIIGLTTFFMYYSFIIPYNIDKIATALKDIAEELKKK